MKTYKINEIKYKRTYGRNCGCSEITDAPVALLWGAAAIEENVKALEKAGVAAIGIHARTTRQGYAGKPRWELLKDFRNEMSVPLIVSGDIYTLKDAIKALECTKADAVMVARGGVGNPILVKQIDSYFKDGTIVESSSLEESIQYIRDLADMLIEEKGEYTAMMVLRGIAPKFLNSYPDMKKAKNKLASALTTRESLERILNEIQ